jgi:hypothetical protein
VRRITAAGGAEELVTPSLDSPRLPTVIHPVSTLVYGCHRVTLDDGQAFVALFDVAVGWLPDWEHFMTPVPLQRGTFVYRVLNQLGLAERTTPNHAAETMRVPQRAHVDQSLVMAHARVQGPPGPDWFVLLDSGGWLFETREGKLKLAPLICLPDDDVRHPTVLTAIGTLGTTDPMQLAQVYLENVAARRNPAELDVLEQKVEAWSSTVRAARREAQLCRVCKIRVRGALLHPCGHWHVCVECANVEVLQSCPTCREPFSSVTVMQP